MISIIGMIEGFFLAFLLMTNFYLLTLSQPQGKRWVLIFALFYHFFSEKVK